MPYGSIFAALYDLVTIPLERFGMGSARRRAFGGLTGTVLDLGAGTGPSIPHFDSADRVVAVDPDLGMLRRSRRREGKAPLHLVVADGAMLPFKDASFDEAAVALALCTIPDLESTMAELRRVLTSQGRLSFIEHVRLEGRPGRWQDAAAPAWKWMAGCHLNRRTEDGLQAAGYDVNLTRRSLGGLVVRGTASPSLGTSPGPGHNEPT